MNGGVRVRHPLALLFGLAFLLAWDGTGLLRLGLACALLHECGHILAYRMLLGDWPLVEVSARGLSIPLRGTPLPPKIELPLAVAGPLTNLALCAAAWLWMQWRGASWWGYWFVAVNLLVGGSNLLPLPGLDGWRILHCLH